MTAQEWYTENMLIEGQKVYETVGGFWVYVKQDNDGTYRIATNNQQVNGHIRTHKLKAFATFEAASTALDDLAKMFGLTEVEPGS